MQLNIDTAGKEDTGTKREQESGGMLKEIPFDKVLTILELKKAELENRFFEKEWAGDCITIFPVNGVYGVTFTNAGGNNVIKDDADMLQFLNDYGTSGWAKLAFNDKADKGNN
jgi:hypothetical protein